MHWLATTAACLSSLTLLLAGSTSAQVQFTETVQVDDDTSIVSNQWYPSAALGPSGEVFVVWSDESAGDSNINFSVKYPGDSVFTGHARVDDGPPGTSQTNPSLSVNETGDQFVVWEDDRDGHMDIRFSWRQSGQPVFEPSKKVNDDSGEANQFDPVIVGMGDSLAVVWEDHRRGEADIYCSFSTDGGETFGGNVMVSDSTADVLQITPDIAIDADGTVYAVWVDGRQGYQLLYFSSSETWSSGFSDDVPVVDSTLALHHRKPSIAAGRDGCVSIVWMEAGFLGATVRLSRTCDGGEHFTLPVYVYSSMFVNEMYPDISAGDDSTIHICLSAATDVSFEQCYYTSGADGRLYHVVSSDSGTSFETSDVTGVSDGKSPLDVAGSSILTDPGGTVHFLWGDTRFGNTMTGGDVNPFGYDVFYNTVSDDSLIGNPVRVNRNSLPYDHANPSIAWAGGDSIYVCWADDRNGTARIYCTMSEDGGNSFGQVVPVALPGEGMGQSWPRIDVSPGGDVQIVWFESIEDSSGGLFFAGSSDIYSGFSVPVAVSDGSDLGVGLPFELETDVNGTINVVWSDKRNDAGDIFFSRSTDDGQTFSPDVRVNGDVGSYRQWYPDITSDAEGIVYVVWVDERGSTGDVYFARAAENGSEFEGERIVNSQPAPPACSEPAIDFGEGGKIYIMWYSHDSIFISTSTDGGLTFSDQRDTGVEHYSGTFMFSSLRVIGDMVNLLWASYVTPDWCVFSEVKMTVSSDGGETFSDVVRVSDDSTYYAKYPAFDIDSSGNILTVWQDPRRDAYTVYTLYGPDPTLDHIFFRKGTVVTGIDNEQESSRVPKSFRFYQNYPNPFNPVTTIRYDLPEENTGGEHVVLRVYTIRGELVATLVDEVKNPGSHSITWDGRNEEGHEVGSGIYFYQINAGDYTSVKKMVFLK